MKEIIFWTTIIYMLFILGVLLWVDRERNYFKSLLEQLGYNDDSVDRDHDGIIQEGTIFERKK